MCLGFLYRMMVHRVEFIFLLLELLLISSSFRTRDQCSQKKLILVYWKTVMAWIPSHYNAELDALFGICLDLVPSELQMLVHPHVLPRCRLEHLPRCRPRFRLEHLPRCRPKCRLEHLPRCRLKHLQRCRPRCRRRFLQRNRLIHQVHPQVSVL